MAGGERGGGVTPSTFLDGRVSLYGGDCLATIKTLADNSIDAVVTDPPYALDKFIAERNEAQRQQKWLNMASGFPTLRVTK